MDVGRADLHLSTFLPVRSRPQYGPQVRLAGTSSKPVITNFRVADDPGGGLLPPIGPLVDWP